MADEKETEMRTHRPIYDRHDLELVTVEMDTRFLRDVHRERAWRDDGGRIWVVARDGVRLTTLYVVPSDRIRRR